MATVPTVMRADSIARLQRSEATSVLLTAEAVSIGGPAWTRTRTTGGDFGPATTATATVTGWAYRDRSPVILATQAPDFTPQDRWAFVALPAVDVREGDTLVSQAAAALVFQVGAVELRTGYLVATLERA